MTESLRSLILRAKAGEEPALAELIERFKPLIKKYARQAATNDTGDVEQELTMRLIQLVHLYREELPHGFMELVEREWPERSHLG